MAKKLDKICNRCAKPTLAVGARCAVCQKKGDLCARCKTNWTLQAKGSYCKKCKLEVKSEQAIVLGYQDLCACGKAKKKSFKTCYNCHTTQNPDVCAKCGMRLPSGESCKRDHRKPWARPEWKARRKELVARTNICEWCSDPFTPPKHPATVVHLNQNQSTGSPEEKEKQFQEYMEMSDLTVRVTCRSCAYIYRRHGVAGRKDPMVVCPKCHKFKQPQYLVCYKCHSEGQAHSSYQDYESFESAIDDANERGCPETCKEADVMYTTHDSDGRADGGGGPIHLCDLKKIESEFPGMIKPE